MPRATLLSILLAAWGAGADYKPLTAIGPTTGWSADADGSGPGIGAEFVFNPLVFLWGSVGVEAFNRAIPTAYAEVGTSMFNNDWPGFFAAPSLGWSLDGPFASLSLPIAPSSGWTKYLYFSPYLRGSPWKIHPTWEAGMGFKFILSCPQMSGFQ